MTAQTLTLISGIVLLFVFALVGWRARLPTSRGNERSDPDQETTP